MVSRNLFWLNVAIWAVTGVMAGPCKPNTSSLVTTKTSAATSSSFQSDTTSSSQTTDETFLSSATELTSSAGETSDAVMTQSTESRPTAFSTTETTTAQPSTTTTSWFSVAILSSTTDSTTGASTETSATTTTYSIDTAVSSITESITTSTTKVSDTPTTGPATTTTTTSAPTETNVLINGGFDIEPAAINPWFLAPKNGQPNADATISLTDEAHDGPRALRLVYGLSYGWAWIHQPIAENLLLPGVKYTFSVQVLHHRGPEWQLCWRAGMACLYGANGATLKDNAEAIGIDSWYQMKLSCTWTAAQLAQGNIKIAMGAASCAGANMIFDTAVLAEAE